MVQLVVVQGIGAVIVVSNFGQDRHEILPGINFRRFAVKLSGLDDFLVHVQLELGPLQNAFLNAVDRDEAKDAHLARLSNAVGAVLCLKRWW